VFAVICFPPGVDTS